MSRDVEAWERMLGSMRVFFRSVGTRTVELDGVIAAVTSEVPERSLPNSVLYETEDQLLDALDELAALYDEAGVLAWTVWVPEYHGRVREALGTAGHKLDANPAGMIAELGRIQPPGEGDPEPVADPTAEELGVVNDLAYATGDAFQRMLASGPPDGSHTYLVREDGRPLASVVTYDHAGDCSVWWVATVPEARGRGLAPGLMRRALADGRERGCTVTTLVATKAGEPVYVRLGYRSLGAVEMWERRRPG